MEDFQIDEIPDYNIFVGPHPQQEADIKALVIFTLSSIYSLKKESQTSYAFRQK